MLVRTLPPVALAVLALFPAPGHASNWFDAPAQVYSLPGDVSDLALGDMNGDGRLDVVTLSGANVSIYTFDGAVGLTPSTVLSAHPSSAVHLADVNEDGRLDILIAPKAYEFQPSLFLSQPDGSLAGVALPTVPYASSTVATADFDHDGHLDLVLMTPQITIFRGYGNGVFNAPRTYPTNTVPPLAVGDLNADGWPDIATGVYDSGSYGTYLINNHDGTFHDVRIVSMQNPSVVDITGDGVDDVVAFSHDDMSVLVGSPDSLEWTSVPLNWGVGSIAGSQPCFGDVDEDGTTDVVVRNSGYPRSGAIVLRGGFPNFPVQRLYEFGESSSSPALGDIDGDGHLDLVTTSLRSFVFHRGHGDGTFGARGTAMPGRILAIQTARFDADPWPDAAVMTTRGLEVYRGTPDGMPGPPERMFSTIVSPESDWTVADANGDGWPDLLLVPYPGYQEPGRTLFVWLNDGAGGFGALAIASAALDRTTAIGVADMNSDGAPDVVMFGRTDNGFTGRVSERIGDRTGAFREGLGFDTSRETRAFALGDVDGDGRVDIVRAGGDGLELLQGQGSPVTFYRSVTVDPNEANKVVLSDLNSDGHLDIVGGNQSIRTRLGLGWIEFSPTVETFPAMDPSSSIELADLNGDGHPDLVERHAHRIAVRAGAGDGRFVAPQLMQSVDFVASLADADADGDLDIVAGSDSMLFVIPNVTDRGNVGTLVYRIRARPFDSAIEITLFGDPVQVYTASVERADSLGDWQAIRTLTGVGAQASVLDSAVTMGHDYTYRVRVDMRGTVQYTPEVTARAPGPLLTKFEIEPLRDKLRIVIAADSAQVEYVQLEKAPTSQGPWWFMNSWRGEAGSVEMIDSELVAGASYFYRLRLATRYGTVLYIGPIPYAVPAVPPTPPPGTPITYVLQLGPLHPNPTRRALTIDFTLARASHARVAVFDVTGREVARLVDGPLQVGPHQARWDGRVGSSLARGGVYIVRFETPDARFSRRFALTP